MPASDSASLLRAGVEQLAIPGPDRVCARLGTYLDELERWNPRFGLVKYGDRSELVVKHVLDSLAAWTAVRDGAGPGGVLDVGSGAGFPGIPLAVALPGLSFTLLERMARRASFLKTCAVLLGLSRLSVQQKDLSEMAGEFDVVTFRAVAPLERFLPQIEHSGVRWRTLIAYKGRADRAREEIDEIRRSAAGRYTILLQPLRPPFLMEERCLVVVSPCVSPRC